jgi:hypothetical protein
VLLVEAGGDDTSPGDPIHIDFDANTFGDPDDLKAAIAAVELCREIGNSAALRPFVSREAIPGNAKGADLEDFVRDAAHQLLAPNLHRQNGHRCHVRRR